jgi:hypothetical protein
MTSEDQMFDHPGHDQHYQPYDSAGNEYGKLEPGSLNVKEGEYHPAADSAMAWLKGYMLQHPAEYLMHKEALASTALPATAWPATAWPKSACPPLTAWRKVNQSVTATYLAWPGRL